MPRIVKASQEYECDRCLGIINQGETYEYCLVQGPPEFNHNGVKYYTICHFHTYDCLKDKPDMYELQEQDLLNIKRHGTSNNL